MNQQQPAKTFISVNKLINGLRNNDLLNDATHIKVLFDGFISVNYYNKRIRNIHVLAVKTMNNNKIIKDIDFDELFDIAGGANIWLNVSTQLNDVDFPLIRRLNEINIDVNPTSFKTEKGDGIFYKINYVNLPNTIDNKKLMSKLNNELNKKHDERFNKLVSSFARDDSEFFDE